MAQRLHVDSDYNKALRQKHSRFALFLGAGASADSNIKLAGQMIDDFKDKIFRTKCEDEDLKEKVENISRTVFDPRKKRSQFWETTKDWFDGQDWYQEDDSEYSKCFEACYPKEVDRRNYIEVAVGEAKPSFGYVVLANLISSGIIKTIITTNFDDLVYFACTSYTSTRPVVYAHGGFASEVSFSSARPKILKLHGDFLYSSLKNLDREVNEKTEGDETPNGVVDLLDEKFNMKQQIIQALREGEGLIVIGYAGNDKSVMDLLHTIPSSHYLFWCVLCGEDENPEDKINDNVKKLLREKDGFLVRTKGFDDVMEQIRQNVGITDDDILSQFRERQEFLTKKLEEAKKSSAAPEASSDKSDNRGNETEGKQATDFVAKVGKYSETLSLIFQADEAFNSGDVGAAEEFYRRAIELDPNYFSAYNNLGYLLMNNPEKQAEAEKLLIRATELSPDNPGPYNNLGNLLERHPERQDEAEKFYREAIKVEPANGTAYSNLGRFYLKHERFEKSLEMYEKALRLEAQPVYPLVGLANLYRLLGNNAKAKAYVDWARDVTAKDDWYNLATIEAVAGNADTAIENLKKAIEKSPYIKGFVKNSLSLKWISDDPRFKELVGED
ncbi:MAG: tetratricopeptide repeat protein [Acidobacteriota bacterium]|nr:tetratricopeptide repeat protein [Acidobacteriota bacterium]